MSRRILNQTWWLTSVIIARIWKAAGGSQQIEGQFKLQNETCLKNKKKKKSSSRSNVWINVKECLLPQRKIILESVG